jgi:hypothetical protein
VDDHHRPDRTTASLRAAIRLGIPAAPDLSRQSWVGERAALLLPALEAEIRRRSEAFGPLAIFLGGSAIHGELCGIEDPSGKKTYLSDLDLGVLTDRRIPAEERGVIASEVRKFSEEGPPARLGFYCLADLERQHPTPGLVETVRAGFVLSGDASLLGKMRMPAPRQVPPWEARRLLANRSIEWLDARSRRRLDPTGAVYAAAKFQADAGAVWLLANGEYDGGGYRERMEAIARSVIDPKTRQRILDWSGWRLDPRWDRVPGNGDVAHAGGSQDLWQSVEETARWIVRSLSGGESARIFLETSRIGGRTWARSWKRWLRAGGRPLRILSSAAPVRTPRLLLWETAIDQAMGHEDRAARALGRLRGGAPVGSGEADREIVRLGALMEREGIE